MTFATFSQFQIKSLFRFKIFNIVLFITTLVIFTVISITNSFKNHLKNERIQKINKMAIYTAENVKQYTIKTLLEGQNLITELELNLKYKNKHAINLSDLLKKHNNTFQLIGMTDEKGHYLLNSEWQKSPPLRLKMKNVTLADREYFQKLKSNPQITFILSEPVISKSTKKWVLVLAKRLNDHKGSFKGMIFVSLPIETLSNYYSISSPEKGTTTALYDEDNHLLSRFPLDLSKITKKIPLSLEAKFNNENVEIFSALCPIENITKYYGSAYIKEFGLKILWGIPQDSIFTTINDYFFNIYLIEAVLFSIIFIGLTRKYLALKTLEEYRISEANMTKLATIGEFSSGIAHEINTPLTIVLWNAKSILKKTDLSKNEIENKLLKIIEMSDRINKIIIGLKRLSYSNEDIKYTYFPLKECLEDINQITFVKLNQYKISFEQPDIDNIEIFGTQSLISQVFLNLFSNSIYEISKSGSDNKWIKMNITLIDNNRLKIDFIDSGNGIPQEIQNKLLNTFYTTKKIGEGTGLGLKICNKIITQLNGKLYINNDYSNTCFTIELPGRLTIKKSKQAA